MRIALGISTHLRAFAAEHDAQTFKQWGGDDWKRGLYRIVSRPEVEIYWNLTGVNVAEGLQRVAMNIGIEYATDWELAQFKGQVDWLSRSTWFRDDLACDQPEELD